jgi:hypothetical protein
MQSTTELPILQLVSVRLQFPSQALAGHSSVALALASVEETVSLSDVISALSCVHCAVYPHCYLVRDDGFAEFRGKGGRLRLLQARNRGELLLK